MDEAGLSVYEDAVGNLFSRREGRSPDAPVVLVESHIDSVYNGGNFDGPLGVLAGIETPQTMNGQEINAEHPVELLRSLMKKGHASASA
jgi:allantoate deiminase